MDIRSTRTLGAASAAPTPGSARAVISIAGVVATPPRTEATTNTDAPSWRTRRGPNIAPTFPLSSTRPPKTRAYAVITQLRPVEEKPRSLRISGSATLTMLVSITSISCIRQRISTPP
jgi:hypothetical protein